LTVGDGHAAQGDGESTGPGLEISMDVELAVDIVHGEFPGQPWAENDEFIMVSGLAAVRDERTIEMARVPSRPHDSEVATVLVNSVRYDIAEIVVPPIHVVAKIEKSAVARLVR